MKIFNARPLPSGIAFGTAPSGAPFLSVILKGTFSMAPTGVASRTAAEQLPIWDNDELLDPKRPEWLVRFESDRVPFKPRADIVLVGDAWAPQERPVSFLDVELSVGALTKVLRVFGDRAWSYSLGQGMPTAVGPAPFVNMPLTYDRAFGGIDERAAIGALYEKSLPWCSDNLLGRGYIGARAGESIHGRSLPNIEDPGALIRSWDACPRPVGCGFFPRSSISRARFAGTFDDKWRAHVAPAPPPDFSFEVYNGAHPELQVAKYLVGNEAVRLTHVDPYAPVLSFALPNILPRLCVIRLQPVQDQGPLVDASPFRLDTLVFIPARRVYYLVWRAVVLLRSADASCIDTLRIDYDRVSPPEHAASRGVAYG